MPVVTTPNDILVGAYGWSNKNIPGRIATEATELLDTVIRSTRGLYSAAARVNPEFFSGESTVVFDAQGWPRPDAAESVYLLELGSGVNAGDEVAVVDYRDRLRAEPGKPCVFRRGKKYRPAGNGKGPTNEDLFIYYSKIPTSPASVNATLDSTWVEQFNNLLMLEVAIYLAIKDGRMAEIPHLRMDRNSWLRLYVGFLEHETVNISRRFRGPGLTDLDQILPLLAGAEVPA